jgi:hypothetical protein
VDFGRVSDVLSKEIYIPRYKSMSETETRRFCVPHVCLCMGKTIAYESASAATRALVLHASFNFQLMGVSHWMKEKQKIHPELAIGVPLSKQYDRGEIVAFIDRKAGDVNQRPPIWAHWVNGSGTLLKAFHVTNI